MAQAAHRHMEVTKLRWERYAVEAAGVKAYRGAAGGSNSHRDSLLNDTMSFCYFCATDTVSTPGNENDIVSFSLSRRREAWRGDYDQMDTMPT